MLYNGIKQRHAEGNIKRKGEPQCHRYVQAGVGLGGCQAHGRRNGDVRSAGGQYGKDKPVAGIRGDILAGVGCNGAVQRRYDEGEHTQKQAIFDKSGKPAGRHHAHFQQKNGQKTFKNIRGEGFDAFGLFRVGDQADDEAAQNQQHAAIGKRMVKYKADISLALGFLVVQHHQDDSHNDGRRFHEGHYGHHVTAESDLLGLQKGNRRDEGDGAHRAVGSRHGPGVADAHFPLQNKERVQGNQGSDENAEQDGINNFAAEMAVR